jgi:hypothetical protein
MNPKGNTIQHIRITCRGSEGNEAMILVNGIEAGSFKTMVPGNEEMHLVAVPAELQNADLMTVTFKGMNGQSSPMIYEVRLSL